MCCEQLKKEAILAAKKREKEIRSLCLQMGVEAHSNLIELARKAAYEEFLAEHCKNKRDV